MFSIRSSRKRSSLFSCSSALAMTFRLCPAAELVSVEKLLDATLPLSLVSGLTCINGSDAGVADRFCLRRLSIGAECASVGRSSLGSPARASVVPDSTLLFLVIPGCDGTPSASAPPSANRLGGDLLLGSDTSDPFWRTFDWSPSMGAACPLILNLEF